MAEEFTDTTKFARWYDNGYHFICHECYRLCRNGLYPCPYCDNDIPSNISHLNVMKLDLADLYLKTITEWDLKRKRD
jgi:hypothetical protein